MAPQIFIIDADSGAASATAALVQRIAPTADIVCETTPERGWFKMQHVPPDVVIIDPLPTDQTGPLLIEFGKLINPALQVIILAAQLTPANKRRLHEVGVDAIVDKAVPPARLLTAIKDVLRRAIGTPGASKVAMT